jgi:hypothetical protein
MGRQRLLSNLASDIPLLDWHLHARVVSEKFDRDACTGGITATRDRGLIERFFFATKADYN